VGAGPTFRTLKCRGAAAMEKFGRQGMYYLVLVLEYSFEVLVLEV